MEWELNAPRANLSRVSYCSCLPKLVPPNNFIFFSFSLIDLRTARELSKLIMSPRTLMCLHSAQYFCLHKVRCTPRRKAVRSGDQFYTSTGLSPTIVPLLPPRILRLIFFMIGHCTDCFYANLRVLTRQNEPDSYLLLHRNGIAELRCSTEPRYKSRASIPTARTSKFQSSTSHTKGVRQNIYCRSSIVARV